MAFLLARNAPRRDAEPPRRASSAFAFAVRFTFVIFIGLALAGCEYGYSLSASVLANGVVLLHSDQENQFLPFGRPVLCIDHVEVTESGRRVWAIEGGSKAGLSCSLRFPVRYGAMPSGFSVIQTAEQLQLGHSYEIMATGFGGSGEGRFIYRPE